MSPHCSAIFLQHSRSADVIAAPGNTHAATGSAASIIAKTETPSLVNSFNITSLSTADHETQQSGKGFSLFDRGLGLGRHDSGGRRDIPLVADYELQALAGVHVIQCQSPISMRRFRCNGFVDPGIPIWVRHKLPPLFVPQKESVVSYFACNISVFTSGDFEDGVIFCPLPGGAHN
jgi:hypothetical protein